MLLGFPQEDFGSYLKANENCINSALITHVTKTNLSSSCWCLGVHFYGRCFFTL